MQTSLQRIANKAKRKKLYRFHNLYTMLNEGNLLDSWRYIKKRAACGVDRVSAWEYEQDLHSNVKLLVDRLKRKGYRAKLVRRQYIPKGKGKLRPLGIPALEDKLLQLTAARILEAIFEQDFHDSSFGYRRGRGAKDAVKELTGTLQFGKFGFVVEADIKGYFDNIDHDWLMEMLRQRVNDEPFLRLVKKWLKAGILDTDSQVIHPVTGTPQGGIISPILANIYLHYVLDLWFDKVIKPQCRGSVYLCRYADDWVCLFQHKEEAEWFYRGLPERLGKFGLKLAVDKSGIVKFSKDRHKENGRFDFLGFEFRWALSRNGKPQIKRRTSRKKFRQSIANFTKWCKKYRHLKKKALFQLLNSKLRGYYNYYGVIGNYASLQEFFENIIRILFKWLNRRSQKKSCNWRRFKELLKKYNVMKPRITEQRNYQLNFL